jgi:hypothetical protein
MIIRWMANGSAASVRPVIGSRRLKPSSTCAPAGVALIRPDGDIGWASRGGELGAHGLRAALRRWLTPS